MLEGFCGSLENDQVRIYLLRQASETKKNFDEVIEEQSTLHCSGKIFYEF